MKLLIVQSEFNSMITKPMLEKAESRAKELGFEVNAYSVPGALEIPTAIKWATKGEAYDAIITIGAIIKGETDHYDAICRMVEQSIVQLQLELEVPILFEVLMVDRYQDAEARIEKGAHAADAALQMIELRKSINA